MDVINLQIVADTNSIVAAYPELSRNPDKPTVIDNQYCYMIGPPGVVVQGLGTKNLILALAPPDDSKTSQIVRWRGLSLSGNSDCASVLYKMWSPLKLFSIRQVLSESECVEVSSEVPLPVLSKGQNTMPPSFTTVLSPDYFLQATVLRSGSLRVRAMFYLTAPDEVSGKPVLLGYVQWRGGLWFVDDEA